MKPWKRRLLILTGVVLLFVLFRGPLFRLLISYEPQVLISESGNWGECSDSQSGDIISLAQKETARTLSYDLCSGDNLLPDLIANRETAHCVGYAALFAARIRGMDCSETLSRVGHFRGQLYLLGWNLHDWPACPAWLKDHDFVVVEEAGSGARRAFDPTLYDYFRIGEVHLHPKTM